MLPKIICIFLSILLFNSVSANCDSAQCTAADEHPEFYARPDEPQAPIMVFISFSMPEQSLKLWAMQAAQLKAPLVLRGFWHNSLEASTQKAFELFGEDMPELLVDPEAFERFHIQAVPAVVVVPPESQKEPAGSAQSPSFDLVYGDTSLEEALTLMGSRGSPAIQKIVRPALDILGVAHD